MSIYILLPNGGVSMTTARHRERKEGWIQPTPAYRSKVYTYPWTLGPTVPTTPWALHQQYCDDELHPGPPYKTGGPLDLWDFSSGSPWGPEYTMYSNNLDDSKCPYRYEGRAYFNPYTTVPTTFTGWKDPNWGDASDYGATGWNKFKPAKPGVDLSVTLAELRETWRDLIKRAKSFRDIYDGRRKVPTNLAGNFLEGNFGWLPFLSDVKKAISTYQSLDSMIDRIRKMNGQWEHRGGNVDSQNETWETTVTGATALSRCTIASNSYFWPTDRLSRCKSVDTFSYTSKCWFEGAFRYYIPDIDTPEWAEKARRKLMGLNVNPSLVWELVPWSWLVDWISNAGDVFSNMDNGLAENLTAAYAYVMRTTTYSVTRTTTLSYLSRISPRTEASMTHTLMTKWSRKHRVAASPFGFGIDFGSFSPKQIAIMAALGLSR